MNRWLALLLLLTCVSAAAQNTAPGQLHEAAHCLVTDKHVWLDAATLKGPELSLGYHPDPKTTLGDKFGGVLAAALSGAMEAEEEAEVAAEPEPVVSPEPEPAVAEAAAVEKPVVEQPVVEPAAAASVAEPVAAEADEAAPEADKPAEAAEEGNA